MEMTKLRKADVKVGVPIPWPLFDEGARMVVLPGFVPRDETQRALLSDLGLYRSSELGVDQECCRESAAAHAPAHATHDKAKGKEPTFAEIAFPVGTPFTLKIGEGKDAPRHQVNLIGWVEGDSLLVTHPRNDDGLVYVKEGQPVHARAGYDRWVCTFDTSVLKAPTHPLAYVHLRYPGHVTASRVRATTRVKTNIIASAGASGDPLRHACTIKDLSLTGMLLHSKERLASPGATLDLYFRLGFDGDRHVCEFEGIVRNVTPVMGPNGPKAWNHGVELGAVPAADRRLLQLYLYARRLEEAD